MISENGGCDEEVRHRVGDGRGKWREMPGTVAAKKKWNSVRQENAHYAQSSSIRPSSELL